MILLSHTPNTLPMHTTVLSASSHAICDARLSPVDPDHKRYCPQLYPPKHRNTLHNLFDVIRQPITTENYTDSLGAVFELPGDPIWKKSLRSQILIIDVDTRRPTNKNQIFNPEKIDWETLERSRIGLVSKSIINHYFYSQIHGYNDKFFNAIHMHDHGNTWTGPHVINELPRDYCFVIAIDADALIHHMEMPMEWLFNRWNITPNTSIALPRDAAEGDGCHSCDSKGNRVLNCGFIVAQSLPYTFEMLDAWMSCTDETRYPGCAQWKNEWSQEQRAFSEYIRYDFNPHNNIEIPCDDAIGYPIMPEKIKSNCTSTFIRHHTLNKGMTKKTNGNAIVQVCD
ncbi:hypothetical protein K469DRAFT_730618 [Zopfia rhizophila CBS 207.26]|uniref:Glycosyltransferase family 31 protein n=1 Tax=Zopfia rhizophila CBS 207.26 TaxID=1314779 RepID=A0A6A6DK48_9PEZI|nr:hypothetical protein K469DRAFT_730618 [Zopfia rhizophila CBS 207.26]